ncbi:MAG: hypothetical protein R8K20_00965 [Gallionellaceae bacterium]
MIRRFLSHLGEYFSRLTSRKYVHGINSLHVGTPKELSGSKLKKKIDRILKRREKAGWKHYFSGKYKLNGHNYANDIISATAYVRSLVSNVEFESISSIIQLIDSNKAEYERIYGDEEGVGRGTLVDIINDITVLQKKYQV